MVGGFFSLTSCAFAQIPSTVQPGAPERQLQVPHESRGSAPVIAVPEWRTDSVPSNAAEIRFVLNSVKLSGAVSLASLASLDEIWALQVGHEVTLLEIFDWAQAATSRLRDRGFLLSQVVVPAQEIVNGDVQFIIFDGFISKVEIYDAAGRPLVQLRPYLDAIEAERPLRAATLERKMLLLNDLGGVTARAYLRAAETSGASDLVVVADRKQVGGLLGIDNRVSRLLGKSQVDATLNFANIVGLNEAHMLRLLASENTDLFLASYALQLPVGSDGLVLQPSISRSRTLPQVPSLPGLRTQSSSAGLTALYPFQRSREQNLTARIGIAGFNSETSVAGLVSSAYRLRTIRFGASWDRVDASRGITLVDAEVSAGLRGLGARDDEGLPGPNRSFVKGNVYIARLQDLVPTWSLLTAFTAQVSNRSLNPSERLGLGGAQFLRAYDASELLGDQGYGVKAELRRQAVFGRTMVTGYAFAEHAAVRAKLSEAPTSSDKASDVGVGARWSWATLNGVVEIAKPMGRNILQNGNKNARIFAGIAVTF